MHGNQSNRTQLEGLGLGSLEVHPVVGSLDPWVEGNLAGMEDTLLEMLLGILILELEGILGQVGGMRDSLVQHWVGSLGDLGGSLAEVVDTLAGLQDIQG